MPVPRLFEAPADPREHWAHVVACVLGLSGPETRAALLAELVGEELPDAGAAQVRERRPLPGGAVADVVVRDGDGRWVVGVHASLAFDDPDLAARAGAVAGDLGALGERALLVVLSPDRRAPEALGALPGVTVAHRSWQRVRDWVQERPERGRAQGVDRFVLREADYVLNAWVAELYRLEALMPLVEAEVREALASAYMELNELSPAPLITMGPADERAARVIFPRTGDAKAEIALQDGAMVVALATADDGPGFDDGAREGWRAGRVERHGHWVRCRAWARATARDLLPARR
jgi:hypothetical protein